MRIILFIRNNAINMQQQLETLACHILEVYKRYQKRAEGKCLSMAPT